MKLQTSSNRERSTRLFHAVVIALVLLPFVAVASFELMNLVFGSVRDIVAHGVDCDAEIARELKNKMDVHPCSALAWTNPNPDYKWIVWARVLLGAGWALDYVVICALLLVRRKRKVNPWRQRGRLVLGILSVAPLLLLASVVSYAIAHTA